MKLAMTAIFHRRATDQRQEPVAVRIDRVANLRLVLGDRVGQIRTLLVLNLPHGTKQVIADVLGTTKERVSRELNGAAHLSEEVVFVSLEVLQMEDRADVAEQIREIRNAGHPLRLRTELKAMTLTRHADGSVEWSFER
jgi:hypothetical protein